jgi:hypothetical protein
METIIPKNFEYFERATPNEMEKLIKQQGDDVCHNIIGSDYIKNNLKTYDYGFIRISPKATIGRMRTRQNTHQLNSFILCRLIPDPLIKIIDIILVCSRPNSKDGKQLLELAEIKAKELGYQRLSLIAVGNKQLMTWYVSQGYVVESDKHILETNTYVYSMKKNIV